MKQRIICAKCDRELPERQTNSGVDVLYVNEEECPRCRRRSGGAKRQRGAGRTTTIPQPAGWKPVTMKVTGYDPEKKRKA